MRSLLALSILVGFLFSATSSFASDESSHGTRVSKPKSPALFFCNN